MKVERWLGKLSLWSRVLLHRRKADQELDDEIAYHIEATTEEKISNGMMPQEARRAARIELGGVEQLKENMRSVRTGAWLDTFLQDIRFGLRILRKSPAFTAIAVLTLALGIGANTAIFSAVNGIVLKPLPYADASQLVSVKGVRPYGSRIEASTTFTPDVWNEVEKQTPAIAQMALYNPSNLTLTGEAVPEILPGAHVSGDFFGVLGVQPLLGRPILATDTQPRAKRVAVVTYEFWRATWGADPTVIGRSVTIDNKDYEVVGVMPPGCIFPLNSFNGGSAKALWLPLTFPAGDMPIEGMAVARLKSGVSIAAANAQLKTVSARLSGDFTGLVAGGHFEATGLKRRFGDLDEEMFTLLGAVGFVLLIACVNVSGLLLARGWGRQREVAVREALGASRLRIARQFLIESVLLAFAGGGLGLLFSVWGVHILRAISPANTQEHGQFRLDAHVLWFTAGVSLLAGILFGLAPAIQMSARPVGGALKENMGGSPGGYSARRTRKVRSALAIVEIGMAVVLVIGATLVARSFEKLTSIRLGFRTDHIMTMKANFSTSTCTYARDASLAPCRLAVSSVLSDMRSVPGVQSAAVASTLPLYPWAVALNVEIEGQTTKVSLANGEAIADRIVSTDYFHALGIPLLSGRDFLSSDTAGAEPVSIVDDVFARRYLGDHPLGQRVSYRNDANGNPEWTDVVGVTESVHDLSPFSDLQGEIYIPFAQATYFQGANFIARTPQNPETIAPGLQRAIWSVDKNTPITALATMDQLVAQSVATPRYQTTLLSAFGGLGLLLAMVGIYGVISYGVSQRTHEIGVRIALGAARGDVLRMVMREGMLLALGGIVIGVGGAMALGRFLQSMLFEVKPTDPATFVGVSSAVALVALAACYLPAQRAMKIDPMIALRHE